MIYFDEKFNAYGDEKSAKNKDIIYTCEDELWTDFQNNPNKYIWKENKIVENPDYEEIQREKEQDRINNLTMTALDFIGVLQSFGLTLEEINKYLEANLPLKMQLTYCQNVYCGVVRQLLPLEVEEITITDDMVVTAFKLKNGEEVEIPTPEEEPQSSDTVEGDSDIDMEDIEPLERE